MTQVAPWVRDIVDDVFGKSSMAIGKTLMHPDGYKVKITDGQYWGTHGLSNFWYWRRVNDDGSLNDKIEHGYGW